MPAGKADGVFPTPLEGQVVLCTSFEDSVAVRAASDILSGDDRGPFKSGELERLSDVLKRYGHSTRARRLRGVNSASQR
jgi:hypothetical protein